MQPLQPARAGGRRTGQSARFEQQVRSDLLQRRWLRVHVCCIAMLTLAVCWGLSALLMHAGVQTLALRHALALLGAYAAYLGLMHLWARWMLARDNHLHPADAVDAVGGIADLTKAKARPSCASGLADAADLDETAVVAVPVAVVVGAALLLATALGFAVFGLSGIDILLATVAAGLLIGHWLPEARSLPHAWQLITSP